jgi:hypothetical protein
MAMKYEQDCPKIKPLSPIVQSEVWWSYSENLYAPILSVENIAFEIAVESNHHKNNLPQFLDVFYHTSMTIILLNIESASYVRLSPFCTYLTHKYNPDIEIFDFYRMNRHVHVEAVFDAM